MLQVNPQYIIDTAGRKMVILPQKDFDSLLEELEDLEDIKAYDRAKTDAKNKKSLPAEDVFKMIEKERKQKR